MSMNTATMMKMALPVMGIRRMRNHAGGNTPIPAEYLPYELSDGNLYECLDGVYCVKASAASQRNRRVIKNVK